MQEFNRIIENGNLNKANQLVRALANKEKLRIIKFISDNPNCISKTIYNKLSIEQAVVSQHLKKLFEEEIVFAKREERKKRLTLNYKKVKILMESIKKSNSK